nr:hypothetical protein [Tanacetum cinerariifolium]
RCSQRFPKGRGNAQRADHAVFVKAIGPNVHRVGYGGRLIARAAQPVVPARPGQWAAG